jgi:hypothetical protein
VINLEKKKHHIKKFKPFSVGKTFGIIYFAFGFIAGIFISLNSYFGWQVWKDPTLEILGRYSIIALPIVYGLSGFIAGILTAWIYNLVAKHFGGIEIEVD